MHVHMGVLVLRTADKTMKKGDDHQTRKSREKRINRHHGMPVNTGVESGFVIMRQDGEKRTSKRERDQRPKKRQADQKAKVLENFFL
jgi:hypothetical protein